MSKKIFEKMVKKYHNNPEDYLIVRLNKEGSSIQITDASPQRIKHAAVYASQNDNNCTYWAINNTQMVQCPDSMTIIVKNPTNIGLCIGEGDDDSMYQCYKNIDQMLPSAFALAGIVETDYTTLLFSTNWKTKESHWIKTDHYDVHGSVYNVVSDIIALRNQDVSTEEKNYETPEANC